MRKRSMDVRASRLLSKIEYARKQPVKCADITGQQITVRDAFPYDPGSRTAAASAMRWALTKCSAEPNDVLRSRENAPFNVRITDLDVRGHGGRAYKVIDPEGDRFDLREDQLLEAIAMRGIAAGGAINGEFVWGIADRQLCLVLVGGAVHAAMVEGSRRIADAEQRRANGEDLSPGKLVIGRLYMKRDGTLHAYLGRCRAPDAKTDEHAFIEMPAAPPTYDLTKLHLRQGANAAYFEGINEIAAAWDDMSWIRRARWSWRDRWEPNAPGDFSSPCIVLMKFPKFDVVAGEVPDELINEVRANVRADHGYKRAGMKAHDLAWLHAAGDRKPLNGHTGLLTMLISGTPGALTARRSTGARSNVLNVLASDVH